MELPKLQIPKSYLTAFAGYSCFLITRHLVKVLRQVNWYLVVSSLAFDFFCSCFISPNLVWFDVLWEKVFNGIAGMVLQQWPSFPGVPHQLHSHQLHFIFFIGLATHLASLLRPFDSFQSTLAISVIFIRTHFCRSFQFGLLDIPSLRQSTSMDTRGATFGGF